MFGRPYEKFASPDLGLSLPPLPTQGAAHHTLLRAAVPRLILRHVQSAIRQRRQRPGFRCVKEPGLREHFRAFRIRSEEHTSELQSRGLISYAVFCLKKKHDVI